MYGSSARAHFIDRAPRADVACGSRFAATGAGRAALRAEAHYRWRKKLTRFGPSSSASPTLNIHERGNRTARPTRDPQSRGPAAPLAPRAAAASYVQSRPARVAMSTRCVTVQPSPSAAASLAVPLARSSRAESAWKDFCEPCAEQATELGRSRSGREETWPGKCRSPASLLTHLENS